MSVRRVIKAAAVGDRDGNPVERGGFRIGASFAVTVAAARSINDVRERHRALPIWRSFARRAYDLPGGADGARRVHHIIPGIALGFATGDAAILTRHDGLDDRLSLPLGAGLGLSTDELGKPLKTSNPYQGSETLALAHCAAASLAATALAAVFTRRGARPARRRSRPTIGPRPSLWPVRPGRWAGELSAENDV